jgi:hypothetical protein
MILPADFQAKLRIAADPDCWPDLDDTAFEKLFSELNFAYAVSENNTLIPTVFALYRHWMQRSEPANRSRNLDGLTAFVEAKKGRGYLGFMPFIEAETDHSVITTAALNMASLVPSAPYLEYAGASFISNHLMTKAHLKESDGAILAALILLGDRRVMAPAQRIWMLLPPNGRSRVADSQVGWITRVHVDFLVWAMEVESNEETLVELAAAIFKLANQADDVLDIKRHLPVWETGATNRPTQVLKRQSIYQVGDELRPRLEKLIAAEHGDEKVLGIAFQPWLS